MDTKKPLEAHFNFIFAGFLLIYGLHGLIVGRIYFPGRHGGLYLEHFAMWVGFLFVLCLCGALMTETFNKKELRFIFMTFGFLFLALCFIFQSSNI